MEEAAATNQPTPPRFDQEPSSQPYIPAGGPPPFPYTPGLVQRPGNHNGGAEPLAVDVEGLRKDFPAISHWSEEMLRSQPVGELAKANAELEYKLGRSGRPTLEMQLDNNFQQVLHTSTIVEAGEDNQLTILHRGRFLPGMLCPPTDAWLKGRDFTPKNGFVPYGQYDVQSLGFNRNLSAKGWAAIHNPGHGRLSIKLFATAASRAGIEKDRREDEPFADLEEFKTALRAASLAQSLVMPWNHSITAIEGFLHSTKYGFKYFRNGR